MAGKTFIVRLTKAEIWAASCALEAISLSDQDDADRSAIEKLGKAYFRARATPTDTIRGEA